MTGGGARDVGCWILEVGGWKVGYRLCRSGKYVTEAQTRETFGVDDYWRCRWFIYVIEVASLLPPTQYREIRRYLSGGEKKLVGRMYGYTGYTTA